MNPFLVVSGKLVRIFPDLFYPRSIFPWVNRIIQVTQRGIRLPIQRVCVNMLNSRLRLHRLNRAREVGELQDERQVSQSESVNEMLVLARVNRDT